MLAPVLSTIHPVKCWDFEKRRRFPVRFPRFSVIFPDFSEEQHSRGGLSVFRENGFQWSAVRNPESCQLNTEHRQLCPFGTLPLFKFDESDWLIWAESIRPAVGRVGFLVWSDPESMEGCLEVQTTA